VGPRIPSLWYDEWLTTEATSSGLVDAFRHAANREGMPPTYFVVMWGWTVADVFDAGSRDRLLLLNTHGNIASPLLSYSNGARPLGERESVSVDEIEVLVAKATTKPCNTLVGRACAFLFLGAPLPQPLAAEFTLESKRDLDQFVIERYRASRPVEVTKTDLVSPSDLPGALALVQRR
jgi:hypothetical protein